MLVTSSQSSTHRPLGLSVEELFALDRQYRHLEQQEATQARARTTSANLNRFSSRSLDLISPSPNPFSPLPSLEVHGYNYNNRYQPLSSLTTTPLRSNSTDQLNHPTPLRANYATRPTTHDLPYQHYPERYRTHYQQSSTVTAPILPNRPTAPLDLNDNRNSCKIRRRPPIKRESSRRIMVRPIVHRRREPSIGSSCESLDQMITSHSSREVQKRTEHVSLEPKSSLVEDMIDDLVDEIKADAPESFNSDDDHDAQMNLFEMRVLIGKTYDTSDISVQLEGSKILVYCHTIEPTDRRGNYRKHEFKTELIVPETVDDDTIVSYLTEQGELIVEGKYHSWAWKQMKNKRRKEHIDRKPSPINKASFKHDGTGVEQKRLNVDSPQTSIKIEPSSSFSTIDDGQYIFTNDRPPFLHFYLRLPFQTLMDAVRIQPDDQLRLLKVFIEQSEQRQSKDGRPTRSPPRICCLPRGHRYDYYRLRVIFLKDNFIRIEVPTIDPHRK